MNAARDRGLLVIADGKRNDISSTAEAYATAFLSDSAFYSDSMTVTPYLGRDSLEPFVKACAQHAKGLSSLSKLRIQAPGIFRTSRSRPPAVRCTNPSPPSSKILARI